MYVSDTDRNEFEDHIKNQPMFDTSQKFKSARTKKGNIGYSSVSLEDAELRAAELDVRNNFDCRGCINCDDCDNCDNCIECSGCADLDFCANCTGCKDLWYQIGANYLEGGNTYY